jgi:hypothetical protein
MARSIQTGILEPRLSVQNAEMQFTFANACRNRPRQVSGLTAKARPKVPAALPSEK